MKIKKIKTPAIIALLLLAALSLPAAAGVPLRAHGQRVPESAEAVAELFALFRGSSHSSTSVTASFEVASNIRLYGTWQHRWNATDSGLRYRFEQQSVTFDWKIRKTEIEVLYSCDRYDTGNRWLEKNAMIRVTRDFSFFRQP